MCVTNLSVTLSSSGGTLRRSPTKDAEFWLLNSPPSAVTFKVTWTAVTVAFRLRLELIFATVVHRWHAVSLSTERGNVPLYTHGPSERPTQRTERTNGRRRSSRHAYSYSDASMWQLSRARSSWQGLKQVFFPPPSDASPATARGRWARGKAIAQLVLLRKCLFRTEQTLLTRYMQCKRFRYISKTHL